MTISKAGIKDPGEPDDTRTDMDIVQAVGKSMQRVTRPRNALDIIGTREMTPAYTPDSNVKPDESAPEPLLAEGHKITF